MTSARPLTEPSNDHSNTQRLLRIATTRPEVKRPFLWYVAAGVVTTGLQAVLFLAIRGPLGSVAANLIALTITTLLNSEFHRRFTFASYPARATRLHLQSLLTFAFYASYGSLVLILLKAIVDQPSANLEAGVLILASLVGGIIRFLLLRWWVFTRKPAQANGRQIAQNHE